MHYLRKYWWVGLALLALYLYGKRKKGFAEPPDMANRSQDRLKQTVGTIKDGAVALFASLGWTRPPGFQSSDSKVAGAQFANEYGSGD